MTNTIFNSLPQELQAQTLALTKALSNMHALRPMTAKLFPQAQDAEQTHKEFVRELVACVIADQQDTADDYTDSDRITVLAGAIAFFVEMCVKYITKGDRLPTDRMADLFIVADGTVGDWYQDTIADNLAFIPTLVQTTQGGKDVSTALFDAVLNTAMDYELGA